MMKKTYKVIAILAMLAILFMPTGSAYAQDSSENGKLVFGEDFTLKSGETLGGDLIVFGGNVTIEEDAVVQGSIVVFGGNVDFAESAEVTGDVVMIGGNMDASGIVDGSITVIGGQIALTKTAVVHGDVGLVGGQMKRDPEAQVNGDVMENIPAPSINIPSVPRIPNAPNPFQAPEVNIRFNPFWEAMNVLFRALAVAAIAMLLTLFLEPNMQRVADAIVRQPVIAGSLGLLTVVLAPLVIIILIVTIILIPVAVLVAFILPLAWLFGVIALGQEVGERFTKAINQTWAPVLTSGFGTFLLMLVGGYVGMIPCVGWLVVFLIGLMAVGGVMMTWFGSRAAPGLAAQQAVEVPPAA